MINPSYFLPLEDRIEHMQWLYTWLEKTLLPNRYEIEGHNSIPQSLSTHPLMALILGETGAGKTRLASEASNLAAKIGYHQIWITCRTIEINTSYFPFCELLQVLMYELTNDQFATLLADVGPSAFYLSVLHPPLKDSFSLQSPDGPSSDPNSMRLHLWNTLASFLDAYQQRIGPLLLILDDLHWVDQDTLALFTHLLQSPWTKSSFNKGASKRKLSAKYPLRVLAAAHSGLLQNNTRLRIWTTQLERINLLARLKLAPFTTTSVNKLVQNYMTNTEDAEINVISQNLYDVSRGNPFFVSEFLRAYTSHDQPSDLVSDPINTSSHDLFTYYQNISDIQVFPEFVAATLEDSLTHVSLVCRKWLGVASVVGNDFSFATVRQLWRLSGDQDNVVNLDAESKFNSEDLLEEALAASIIREVPFSIDHLQEKYPLSNKRYCFWHPLLTRYIQIRLSQPRLLRLRLLITQLNRTQDRAELHESLFSNSPILSTAGIMKTKQYTEDTAKKEIYCGVFGTSYSPKVSYTEEKFLSEQLLISKYIVPEVNNQKEIAMPMVLSSGNMITSVQDDVFSNEELCQLICQLTPKEREIISLISAGCDTEGLIQKLYLTKATVRTHIRNLLHKLGVSSRLKAVLLWQEYVSKNELS